MSLVIDDAALPKKGGHSVGVAPQYAPALGKSANWQTLVSATPARGEVRARAAAAAPSGAAPRTLPESWAEDPARLDRAGVPEGA